MPELFPSEKQPYWQNFTASVSSCSSVAVSNNALACLRKANASEIASAYPGAVQAAGGVFGFNPSIDGQFIPELPSKILASGNYAQIPFIAGTNLDEGKFASKLPTIYANQVTVRYSFHPNNWSIRRCHSQRIFRHENPAHCWCCYCECNNHEDFAAIPRWSCSWFSIWHW